MVFGYFVNSIRQYQPFSNQNEIGLRQIWKVFLKDSDDDYRWQSKKKFLENFIHTLYTYIKNLSTEKDNFIIGKWPDLELDEEKRNNVTKLKNKYPHLKVMVAIGGWQDGSIKYSKMAASLEKRRNFINNTIKFIKYVHFCFIGSYI